MFNNINKWVYFIIQFVLSLFVTSLTWYLFFIIGMNEVETSFTPLIALLVGTLIHVVLTILYILYGWKKVEEWKWWCILVSAGINIATFLIGIAGAVAVSYLVAYY